MIEEAKESFYTFSIFINEGKRKEVEEVIQYPRFTKLIIVDIMKTFESIPKRLEEDYHSIKDDTLLVSVYTTGNVTLRGMLITDDQLTDAIRDTQSYKDYEEKFKEVDIPMIQPEPVKSTQGTNKTPRATRTPNLLINSTEPRFRQTAKVYEEQQNVAAVEEKILEVDMERIVEGEEEESDGTEFTDLVFLIDEDFGNRALKRKLIKLSKILFTSLVQRLLMICIMTIFQELSSLMSRKRESERELSTAVVTTLISQEFAAHAPKIIEELFRIHMHNTVLNVHPTSSASTATITFDLQQQLYLKMKSDVQAQVADPWLWGVLGTKFEKSYASVGSCRDDAFRKHDQDEHQGDDAPHEGEKRQQQQQQKDRDAWVDDLIINEDERNMNEPPRYQYNKDLFFLKYGNTKEKMYVLSLHKIKINLTAPTLIFPGIEKCNPFSIVDKPSTGLIYLNNKNEKRFMDLEDLSKFCDATLEKRFNAYKTSRAYEKMGVICKWKTKALRIINPYGEIVRIEKVFIIP
nr:hypothetical protein [Tanacetum cinerariifolium]